MSNHWFRFKQFTIYQDRCAMKVGTDGVLLGAWASVENVGDPDKSGLVVLDVGTGTGLIALMIAQRNPQAKVVAIDVDKDAVEQAIGNVTDSPFADRISIEHSAFSQFAQHSVKRFDLIVSNPPFFSDSLLPPDKRRAGARHTVSLTLDELLLFAKGCLTHDGILSLILPYDKQNELQRLSEKHGFYMKRKTIVYPYVDAAPKRLLAELTQMPVEEGDTDSLIIETTRHCYTPAYNLLVEEFYLGNR